MSVQRAYIDYLRIASWDDQASLFLTADLRKTISKWRPGFWLQYKGHYGDTSFYGIGEQNRKRHYVWRSAGSRSSVLFNLASDAADAEWKDVFYCTRIDVQVTIKMPTDYNPFTIYEQHKGGGRLGVTIIESPTGSTLYFGSRVSDKIARLYEKRYDDGDYLRLEFEFKGKLAKAVYTAMGSSSVGPTAVFQNYLPKFGLADYIMAWFDTGPDAEPLRLELEHVEDIHKKMSWLTSLSNTVVKMGNEHETGDFVRRLLNDWLERIDINK